MEAIRKQIDAAVERGVLKDSPEARNLILRLHLELAFSFHANPKTAADVHHVTNQGEVFDLIFKEGENKEKDAIFVSYFYLGSKLAGAQIHQLPEHWTVIVRGHASRFFVVEHTAEGKIRPMRFVFDLEDPFASTISDEPSP